MASVDKFKKIFVGGHFIKPISTEKRETKGEDGVTFTFPNCSVEDLENAIQVAQEASSKWFTSQSSVRFLKILGCRRMLRQGQSVYQNLALIPQRKNHLRNLLRENQPLWAT